MVVAVKENVHGVSQSSNLRIHYLLSRIGLLRAVQSKEAFQELVKYEQQLIVTSRQSVFEYLIEHHRIARALVQRKNNPSAIIMGLTFERSCLSAKALAKVLRKKLGYKAFRVHSLKGHYMVKSQCTGMVYDLITTKGIHETALSELDYVRYLKERSIVHPKDLGVFISDFYLKNAPKDGFTQ